MKINKLREQRRKDIANKEKEDMLRRYPYECGISTTRKATPDEMSKTGRKTSKEDYDKFLKNSICTY